MSTIPSPFVLPTVLLNDEPTGTLARTIPRAQVQNLTQALASSVPTARIVALPAGMKVSNLSLMVSVATGETGGSHAWVALTDNNANVLAVSNDSTAATYFAAGTYVTTPLASSVTTSYTGDYYCVVCVTATQAPNVGGAPGAGANAVLSGTAPTMMGTFPNQSTPPAVGANLGTLTAQATNANVAFWLS